MKNKEDWNCSHFDAPHNSNHQKRTLADVKIFACRKRHSGSPEQKYVQVASHSEVCDCCCIGCHSTDPCTMAGPPAGRCAGFIVSLRRHVFRVVWGGGAGVGRDSSLRSRLLLLFSVSNAFSGCKAPRDTTSSG